MKIKVLEKVLEGSCLATLLILLRLTVNGYVKNIANIVYDSACGTGGMLSVGEEYLHSLNASIELVSFGQKIND